ncbi:MAG TPA: isochorismatase family cysteine hydrolase [Puia sp.]|jgi:nicotinamidase-related amidase|nr:isochorismatase family cysteine hydrolase [Puia sp.]
MEKNSQRLATALLVMDIQEGTIGRVADSKTLLHTLGQAIAAARTAKIPVIYVVVGFRKGFPEIGDGVYNKSFAALKGGSFPGLEEPVPVDAAIAPQPGEMVVTKRRVSAFAGSDLEVILRAHRIEHLVLAGISTSGVVLSTLRQAADMDYRLSVLSDGCADTDNEVHSVLVNKVFPRQAEVLTVMQWIDGLA